MGRVQSALMIHFELFPKEAAERFESSAAPESREGGREAAQLEALYSLALHSAKSSIVPTRPLMLCQRPQISNALLAKRHGNLKVTIFLNVF